MFKFMAAPLEDTSDPAIRALWHRYGADMTFTEMAHVTALARKNPSAWRRVRFPDQTPVEVQILPSNEDDLESFLSDFTPHKGFRGFNFNLGCPSPKVTHAGLGCAMVKRVTKTQKMIDIVKKHKYPISLKIRLGMNSYEKQKKAYLNIIRDTTPDYFVVHARHGKQKYGEPADFSVYSECVETGKIIIANGDIRTKEDIIKLKKIGIKGAMIGRAAIRDPGIFNRLKNKEAPNPAILILEYIELAKKYEVSEHYTKNVLLRLSKNVRDDNLLI